MNFAESALSQGVIFLHERFEAVAPDLLSLQFLQGLIDRYKRKIGMRKIK